MVEKKFRIAEIFGPTIQGEGRHIGIPCHFIRFGGCDYRCSWCDSPHAVLPEEVAQLQQMTYIEIAERVLELPKVRWVVYSGGNPALFDLNRLTAYLQGRSFNIMVETQGSIWNDWLQYVDELCISPKPPSSGNPTMHPTLKKFVEKIPWMYGAVPMHYFKVVVFDDKDYEYAKHVHEAWPDVEMFLSAGNEDPSLPTVGNPHPMLTVPPYDSLLFPNSAKHYIELQTQQVVLKKMKWLMEKVARDIEMRDVRVLPQMHVLAWGNERGR